MLYTDKDYCVFWRANGEFRVSTKRSKRQIPTRISASVTFNKEHETKTLESFTRLGMTQKSSLSLKQQDSKKYLTYMSVTSSSELYSYC